jgi:hypothetical protein
MELWGETLQSLIVYQVLLIFYVINTLTYSKFA